MIFFLLLSFLKQKVNESQKKQKYDKIKNGRCVFKRCSSVFTVAANTAGRLRGPVSHRGADDGAASDGQVTGVARVLDDCTHGEQAAVAVCQIRRAVLHCGGSNTTFMRRQNEKMPS